jgi:hypothetical protein
VRNQKRAATTFSRARASAVIKLIKGCGGEVGHRNESTQSATQVSLVGSSHKSKYRITGAAWLNREIERQL